LVAAGLIEIGSKIGVHGGVALLQPTLLNQVVSAAQLEYCLLF
jgi:hypothetical protein